MSESIQKDCNILCDMCSEEDRKPARKTCMKCEISMCVQHLQAHLTTPVLLQTHPLTEPMALGENMKCSQHGKLLEYYCLDDMSLVCVSCAIEDQHRLHNMKTFSTAHKELMEKLRAEQQVLQEKTDDEDVSLEKWEQSEKEKLDHCSVRLIEAVTNLRDVSLTSIQSSVSARMVAIRTSRSSMEAAQKEKDTFKFLQMFSQVIQDVEKAKAVDLRKGLEPGSHRDELVEEIREKGEKMMEQSSGFIGSLLMLVDPENHQELIATGSDLIFEPQSLGPGLSLSKDSRKVFYNSWLGKCSVTLLIRSTQQSTPNFQRWIVSLNKESDWMIGLCDKQAVNNPKNGPVYGLSYEGNNLRFVTTEYKDHPDASSSRSGGSGTPKTLITQGEQFNVCSELLTYQDENEGKVVLQPKMVEVFWNIVGSKLTFYRRTGRYQREEMITTETKNGDLVPFVWWSSKNVLNITQQLYLCKQVTSFPMTHCSRCRNMFSGPFITEVACELL